MDCKNFGEEPYPEVESQKEVEGVKSVEEGTVASVPSQRHKCMQG